MHNPHQFPDLVCVEIDDSGDGLPQNPNLYIGVLRCDNQSLRIFKIPENFFTTEFKYRSRIYQYYIVEKVAEAFNELGIEPERCLIRVCRAPHFLVLKRWLSDNGFEYENAKITGELQERLRQYKYA